MEHAVTMRNVYKTVDDFQLESIDLEIEKGTISALDREEWGWKKYTCKNDYEFNETR